MRPKSGDRKSLVDDGRWLSLDRRGSTKSQVKQTSGVSSVTSAAISAETKNGTSEVKRSVSRSPSRAKSREKSRSPSRGKSQDASDQEERDARSFWVSMDSSQAQAEEIRKSSSMSMSRKTSGKQSVKKTSRASADRKISDEPPVDYDQGDAKSKNSKIKRGSQVTKRQMESSASKAVSESAFSSTEQQRYNMNSVNNEDYNRGTNYPMVKHSTGARQDSSGDTLKRNSTSLSRRGTIIDSNINRDGFGRDNEHSNAVAIRSRNGSNANDSKHFLSLQLFNKVNMLIYRGISLTCKCSF